MVPLVLLTLMLVIQFGFAYHTRQVVAGAAQDGAASGARRDSSAATGAALTDSLIEQGAGSLVTSHSASGSSDGEVVTVTAQATVVRVLPLFPAITVRAQASATVEVFEPQPGP
jgi:hypothetical protein